MLAYVVRACDTLNLILPLCCYLALEQSSRLPRKDAGYASVMDVTNSSSSHHDEMKGWLLTTFKWVWLLQNEARKIDGKLETSVPPSRDVISSTAGHLLMPWLE